MKNSVDPYKWPGKAPNLSLLASCNAEAWSPTAMHLYSWKHALQVKNFETAKLNLQIVLGLNRSLVTWKSVGNIYY